MYLTKVFKQTPANEVFPRPPSFVKQSEALLFRRHDSRWTKRNDKPIKTPGSGLWHSRHCMAGNFAVRPSNPSLHAIAWNLFRLDGTRGKPRRCWAVEPNLTITSPVCAQRYEGRLCPFRRLLHHRACALRVLCSDLAFISILQYSRQCLLCC